MLNQLNNHSPKRAGLYQVRAISGLLLKGVHIEQPVVNQNCHAEPNGRSIPTCAMPESDSIGRINQQNPVL